MANQYDIYRQMVQGGFRSPRNMVNYQPLTTNQMNDFRLQGLLNNMPSPNRTGGSSSLGQQMATNNLMGMANRRSTPKSPPNFRDNLLNMVLSPSGQGYAQGLLEASQYSKMPVSFGQALAQGMKRSNENLAREDLKKYREQVLGIKEDELDIKRDSLELAREKNTVQAKSRDIKIAELVGRGVPRNEAADIVDGNLEVNFSETGVTTVFNPVTKTTNKYGSPISENADSSFINPQDLTTKQVTDNKINITNTEKMIPKLLDMSARAENIFGTGNKFKDIGSAIAGITPSFFDQYLIDPDVVQAKKDYGIVKKDLEEALVNSPRFNEAEVQRILELLPDETSFLQDPQAGAIALQSIANSLQESQDQSKSLLTGTKIEKDIMQGAGVQINPFIPKTEADLSNIKSGQYFIYNGELRIMK